MAGAVEAGESDEKKKSMRKEDDKNKETNAEREKKASNSMARGTKKN